MKKLILVGALVGTLLVGCTDPSMGVDPDGQKKHLISQLEGRLWGYSRGDRTAGDVVGACLSLYLNFPETKNAVCDEFIEEYVD